MNQNNRACNILAKVEANIDVNGIEKTSEMKNLTWMIMD